jgi:hypothetical protein
MRVASDHVRRANGGTHEPEDVGEVHHDRLAARFAEAGSEVQVAVERIKRRLEWMHWRPLESHYDVHAGQSVACRDLIDECLDEATRLERPSVQRRLRHRHRGEDRQADLHLGGDLESCIDPHCEQTARVFALVEQRHGK